MKSVARKLLLEELVEFPASLLAKCYDKRFNPFVYNVLKWSDTVIKSCSLSCKIFKVCLAILGRYSLKE